MFVFRQRFIDVLLNQKQMQEKNPESKWPKGHKMMKINSDLWPHDEKFWDRTTKAHEQPCISVKLQLALTNRKWQSQRPCLMMSCKCHSQINHCNWRWWLIYLCCCRLSLRCKQTKPQQTSTTTLQWTYAKTTSLWATSRTIEKWCNAHACIRNFIISVTSWTDDAVRMAVSKSSQLFKMAEGQAPKKR